ncbi:hypothetical protein D9M72_314060 [compost metagenome]
MPRKVVDACRHVPQARPHGCGRIGIVQLQGQAGAQQAQVVALALVQPVLLRFHVVEAALQLIEIARVELHIGVDDMQAEALLHLLRRQQAHQPGHPAQLAARQQRLRAAFDHARRGIDVTAPHGMEHGLVNMATTLIPAPRSRMQGALPGLAALCQAGQQHLAQHGVDAIPGFVVVAARRRDEEVVSHHPAQAGLDE